MKKKRGEEKKKRKGMETLSMKCYVFVWNLYGSVCMDINGSISRV